MLSRMNGLEFLWRGDVILPVAGFTAAVLLWWTGCLGRSALDGAPRRDLGWGVADLVMALVLMVIGMVFAQELLAVMKAWTPEGVGTSSRSVDRREGSVPTAGWIFLQQALTGQILVHGPVVGYVLWRCLARSGGIGALGIWPRRPVRDVMIASLALAAVLPMALGLGIIVTVTAERFFDLPSPHVGHEMLDVLARPQLWWVTVGLLGSALVLAPILEELVFRGLAQTALLGSFGSSAHWSVTLVAAAVFALMHIGQPWQVLPSLFLLGVALGWLYERTGSLLPSIFVHAGFNAVNVMIAMWSSRPNDLAFDAVANIAIPF